MGENKLENVIPKSGLHYGEMAKYPEFVDACEDLVANLKEVEGVLDEALPLKQQYDKLTTEAQIELDLLLAFALNSLHWIHLRLQGIDPNTHRVKDELDRIKATMLRWQQVKDRVNRPKVDVDAAKRFVRSGLYDPSIPSAKQNKRMKFNNSEEE